MYTVELYVRGRRACTIGGMSMCEAAPSLSYAGTPCAKCFSTRRPPRIAEDHYRVVRTWTLIAG